MQGSAQKARQIVSYFSDYEGYHRTHGNKVCHYFGVPLIVFSSLGLLWQLSPSAGPVGEGSAYVINYALILWGATSLWYLKLDFGPGVLFSLLLLVLAVVASKIQLPLLWFIFVGGWIIQFVGHIVYEKKSPAFFKNLRHMFIAPFWIFCKAIRVDRALN